MCLIKGKTCVLNDGLVKPWFWIPPQEKDLRGLFLVDKIGEKPLFKGYN